MTGPERLALIAKRSGRTVDDVTELWNRHLDGSAIGWFEEAMKQAGEIARLTAENERLTAENERLSAKLGNATPIPGSDCTPRA